MSYDCRYYIKNQKQFCGSPITTYNSKFFCSFHLEGANRLKDKICMRFYRTKDNSTYFGCNNPSYNPSIYCLQHVVKRKNSEENINDLREQIKRPRTDLGGLESKDFVESPAQGFIELEKNQPIEPEKNQLKEPEKEAEKKELEKNLSKDPSISLQEFNDLKNTIELMKETQNHILLKLYKNNKQDVINIQAAIGAKVLLDRMNTKIFSIDSD